MMRLYTVILERQIKPSPEQINEHVSHLKSLNELLFASGPFLDGSGGMVILKVSTEKEAIRIMERDPFIIQKLSTYTIKEWDLTLPEISKEDSPIG